MTFDDSSAHVGTSVWEATDAASASWSDAHEALQRIARRRAALDAEEARWLLIARREKVHAQFGYATFLEYAERILGYAPRTAIERVRIAEALENLPETRVVFADGGLNYSAIREITRIATAETEQEWLDAAAGKTVREIVDLVKSRRPGDRPKDPPDPSFEPRRWSVDLEPDVYASMLEARRRLEEETGGKLDDSAFVAVLCERILPGVDGDAASSANYARPPHQIAITVCERCECATQDAAGQVIDIAPSVLARARCDAEYIGRLDADTPTRLTTDVPPAIRRLVLRRDHGRCTVPGCRASKYLHIHHIDPREAGGDHSLANLTTLCSAHHRAHHDGRLSITGAAPARLRFEHLDGRPYGSDLFGLAASALRNAGYDGATARTAVEHARAHVGTTATLEEVIRMCFRECPRGSS